MNLLILPGNSPEHKEWAERVADFIHDDYDKVAILNYSHWETGEKILDFNVELEKLTKLLDYRYPFAIFAKSAGTLLAMKAMTENNLSPVKSLFLGVPVEWARSQGIPFGPWAKSFKGELTIIENEFDRTGYAGAVRTFFDDHGIDYDMTVIKGEHSHDYNNMDLIREKLAGD